jgi:3-phenylpropionate/cinnamic acid dioxygenase small subunit
VADSLLTRRDVEVLLQVQQFYYREAHLLQDLRFNDWLALFTEDATYRIPVREMTRFHGSTGPNQEVVDDDLAFDYINESKPELATRVSRLLSGLAHVEEPQPITTRLITNVEVEQQGDSSAVVYSNFHVIRVKEQRQPQSFFGSREDRITRLDDRWYISARRVVFGQRILEQPVSLLF